VTVSGDLSDHIIYNIIHRTEMLIRA